MFIYANDYIREYYDEKKQDRFGDSLAGATHSTNLLASQLTVEQRLELLESAQRHAKELKNIRTRKEKETRFGPHGLLLRKVKRKTGATAGPKTAVKPDAVLVKNQQPVTDGAPAYSAMTLKDFSSS